MTIMDTIEKIEAEIEALPAEYRALLRREQSWAQRNWGWLVLAAFVIGAIVGVAA